MDKPKQPKSKSQQRQTPNQINEYVKYSGLTFQMAALILLGYWVGGKLDDWLDLSIPIFTIVLIVAFIVLNIYSLIRSLPKD